MVIGGYPTDSKFQSYEKNATALLITIPVDAHADKHEAATAWERTFLQVVWASSRLRCSNFTVIDCD
jgi:hypothetical protein